MLVGASHLSWQLWLRLYLLAQTTKCGDCTAPGCAIPMCHPLPLFHSPNIPDSISEVHYRNASYIPDHSLHPKKETVPHHHLDAGTSSCWTREDGLRLRPSVTRQQTTSEGFPRKHAGRGHKVRGLGRDTGTENKIAEQGLRRASARREREREKWWVSIY